MLYKTHILAIDYFHRLVARENARFQNYANRIIDARGLARQRRGGLEELKKYQGCGAVAVAACGIPCACTSDQFSQAMQKVSMCRIARDCASAAAAMSAQLRRTEQQCVRSCASAGAPSILTFSIVISMTIVRNDV